MFDEDEVLCRYGTALEPLEEDEIPSKKPISIEDQIVTDINGKRRFHGAFTGGFSAGFWNTVGSQEGWKPTEFKSSRSEKAAGKKIQRPEDFMDDEDLGEFGIAPQTIQATDKFATNDKKTNKRKLEKPHDGPIPGVPVLQTFLEPAKDNIAVKLLKKMGWKEGQGVGARQTRKEKKTAKAQNKKELYLIETYGADIKSNIISNKTFADSSEDETDISDTEITFAPDDFTPFVTGVKDNLFGLGYSGLSRDLVLKNQQTTSLHFEVVGRNNKKFSITGQAFGVGALEEDDDDIYAKEDLTRYDFSLEDKKKNAVKAIMPAIDGNFLEGFITPKSKQNTKMTKKLYVIEIPINFRPRNWGQRKTRFEPLDENIAKSFEKKEIYKTKNLDRHIMKPEDRGELLNEKRDKSSKTAKPKNPNPLLELLKTDRFTKGEILNNNQSDDIEKIKTKAFEITKELESSTGIFAPFALDPAKQERYDKFLKFKENDIEKCLKDIQPIHFKDWDREMEKNEFVQAKNMFKPLNGLMSSRFVTESEVKFEEIKKVEEKKDVVIKRTKISWKPNDKLCIRFNVTNPFGDYAKEEPKKKTGFSIFNYLENNLNDRKSFVTPIIRPQKTESKSEQIIDNNHPRVTTKDMFKDEIKIQERISLVEPTIPISEPTPTTTKMKENIKPSNKTEQPRTELEKRVVETRHIHPSNKKDLFKCIFESSDDEAVENDVTDNSEEKKTEMINTLLKPLASDVNILRNNSPPRGIFANLFLPNKTVTELDNIVVDLETKTHVKVSEIETPKVNNSLPKTGLIKFRSKEERLKEETLLSETDVYGPKLPESLPNSSKYNTNIDKLENNKEEIELDKKLQKMLKKSKSKIIDEWIEKDTKSHKKKKKKEKSKEKHKKHKKEKKKRK